MTPLHRILVTTVYRSHVFFLVQRGAGVLLTVPASPLPFCLVPAAFCYKQAYKQHITFLCESSLLQVGSLVVGLVL